jgi:hypothetical protein
MALSAKEATEQTEWGELALRELNAKECTSSGLPSKDAAARRAFTTSIHKDFPRLFSYPRVTRVFNPTAPLAPRI